MRLEGKAVVITGAASGMGLAMATRFAAEGASLTAADWNAQRLEQAVGRSDRTFSVQGMLEYLFTLAFKGLVYPQIWEDPAVDMEALAITPESRVVTIASGGCNVPGASRKEPSNKRPRRGRPSPA